MGVLPVSIWIVILGYFFHLHSGPPGYTPAWKVTFSFTEPFHTPNTLTRCMTNTNLEEQQNHMAILLTFTSWTPWLHPCMENNIFTPRIISYVYSTSNTLTRCMPNTNLEEQMRSRWGAMRSKWGAVACELEEERRSNRGATEEQACEIEEQNRVN